MTELRLLLRECCMDDASVRKQIMDGLTWLGLEYDEEANKANHEGVITTPNSKITAMIVPTNEELMIARDVVRLAKLDKLNKIGRASCRERVSLAV